MKDFTKLELIEPLLHAIRDVGYTEPTPIQALAIPPLLDDRDVVGCAQTGTGKTAAFALPVLQLVDEFPQGKGRRPIRALVLSPTRELAAQIGESFKNYGKYLQLRHTVIFGGVSQHPQVKALRRGVDIVVATPGRLLDLMGQGEIQLDQVEFFVLDEADRMLDMGFIHDVKRVIKELPDRRDRQSLLFSATMPQAIKDLAAKLLYDPVHVEATPESTTVEKIDQHVCFVEKSDKKRLLAQLIDKLEVERAIVFTRTKHGANRLVKQLDRAGHKAAAIHGNKSQNARTRALNAFREGNVPILVATDIAARGIDVDEVSHVFNYDLPNISESYVHRIGRTARAGRGGVAVAFCDDSEGEYLRDIENLIDEDIPVFTDHDFHHEAAIPPPRRRNARRSSKGNRSSKSGRGRGGNRSRSSKSGGGSSRGRRRGGRGGGGGGRNRNRSESSS